jgi:peptidoglycan/xylan/chitin deacetylase (PgdA/CDA1 family)
MSAVVRVLGSRPVSAVSSRLTARRLRVLAYHGIDDVAAFARQLDRLSTRYSTVTGGAVADWLLGRRTLPARAVWITFDDGDPSVVRHGAPLLAERGMVATMFVCPGVIDTCRPHWWHVVQDAGEAGLTDVPPSDLLPALKVADDPERRKTVGVLTARLRAVGSPPVRPQLTSAELRAWTAAGHEVGNHSWDHPCLDRCAPEEQRRQIERAHDWLADVLGRPPDVFAWPNGNRAEPSLDLLRVLGYRLVLACDHKVCARRPDPMGLSRLRIDADAEPTRFDAIVSGAHSVVFHAATHLPRSRRRG